MSQIVVLSCKNTRQIEGLYIRVFDKIPGGVEFAFTQSPNIFHCMMRSEMGVSRYSFGTWQQIGKEIHLTGFTKENIHVLNLRCELDSNSVPGAPQEIIVKYAQDGDLIHTQLIIDGVKQIRLLRDTSIRQSEPFHKIQVKTFLVYEGGLLSSPPTIDTLSSREFAFEGQCCRSIKLQTEVHPQEFHRVQYVDTLRIQSRTVLVDRKGNKLKIYSRTGK